MKYSIICAAAAAGLLFGATAAKATTYYVSQSSGNDSWTGQAAAAKGADGPWKTLVRASANYAAGDRILLKRGDTWNEELRPKGSGTPENRIVISSYGEGARPVIDRQDSAKDLIGIHLADQDGFTIVGIEFARCMTGIYAEYSDGCPARKFLWIENCLFRDSPFYQHYEDYPKRKIGLGICLFSHECRNKIVLSDITVKNCRFLRLASGIWTNSPDNFNKEAGGVYNFGNLVVEGCTTEEGLQWQLGLRGVDGGAIRKCVFHDTGRGFQSFNGVAGAMLQRCRNMVIEDSEWGFVSIGDPGKVSGDGQAFDFEEDCSKITVRNCLFHDTDGPGFLLCYGASGHVEHRDIVMDNCVLNGKAMRVAENKYPNTEIFNCSVKNQIEWKNCRFYLSPGEKLFVTGGAPAGQEQGKMTFTNCLVKNLSDACSTDNLAAKAAVSVSSQEGGGEGAKAIDGKEATAWKASLAKDQWIELAFNSPQMVNEFRISEAPSSSVIRYVIECWDPRAKDWVGCFNGRTIGADFVAPIVSRTTQKVRLMINGVTSGCASIAEFGAYNDTTGGLTLTAVGQPKKVKKPVVVSNPAQDPTRPVPGEVRWFGRNHASYVARTKAKNIDLCFLGDSVTAMWPGDLFNKYYGQLNAVNFGVGGDRTQHVLWRLANGELEGTTPKVVVLLIGTNNSVFNPPEEIALGVEAVVKTLRTKFPQTKILLLAIFPRRDALRAKTDAANKIIAKLDDGKMIRYCDLCPMFLDKEGKVQGVLMADDVHLSRNGYEVWAKGMNPLLAEMMKK